MLHTDIGLAIINILLIISDKMSKKLDNTIVDATVKSRCEKWTSGQLETYLHNLDKEVRKTVAELQTKNPSLTIRLAKQTELEGVADLVKDSTINLRAMKRIKDQLSGAPKSDAKDMLIQMRLTLQKVQVLFRSQLIKNKKNDEVNARMLSCELGFLSKSDIKDMDRLETQTQSRYRNSGSYNNRNRLTKGTDTNQNKFNPYKAGQRSYSGCYYCKDKTHQARDCPKKSSGISNGGYTERKNKQQAAQQKNDN